MFIDLINKNNQARLNNNDSILKQQYDRFIKTIKRKKKTL